MSRSGYSDDCCYGWEQIRSRGAVASAIRGKRGQAAFAEMLAALAAMPEKRLIAGELETPATGMPFALKGGDVCALGALGKARGIDMSRIDPHEPRQVAAAFDIPYSLAAEIAYMNDEFWLCSTPEERYWKMRKWILACIKKENVSSSPPQSGQPSPEHPRSDQP